jgi:hypothetical protein
MSEFYKGRMLQLIVMMLAFLLVFVPYFIAVPELTTASTKLVTITAIANAFTIVLAVYSQFKRGINVINRRAKGWYFKAYMLTSILLMLIFYLLGQDTGPYHWVMYAIITPLSSVNYGILVFYMASTCARAFRARNLRALLLLVAGGIVLLYQAPLTGVYFPWIEPMALYLNNTFANAAAKMFLISVTVGALIFGIRVLLGQEPTVLGVSKEE